ncbi:YheU family protein [Geomonas diazotrophica]|uniref:YheU family protein n=1 Tax=Geomonas diazotrophica TaxID=2843197 RepID=UPI001EF12E19|nr:YheU family protein [Geomonas nitrogeniifigens]
MIRQLDETDDLEMVDVPYDRLNTETLRSVISEFVTRDWDEMGFYHYTLDEKTDQVMAQLKSGKAKLVFDPLTNSCNIIPVT